MFTLIKSATFKTVVTLNVPNAEGTTTAKKLRAEFKFKTQREIDALLAGGSVADADLLTDVLTGWDGFTDADGADIAFTEENKTQAIDLPFVRVALVQAYVASINGVQNRTKN